MKTYLINLDSREDRLRESQSELSRMGLSFERFSAISGENKHLSFNRSQYECIKKGYESGEECFMVLEDDCLFDGQWQTVEKAMKELPVDWELFYLGANICTDWFKRPERYSFRLSRLWDCWQSHAIIYSRQGAKNVLDRFNVDGEGWYIFDEWIRQNILPEGNTYLLTPMMCYQRASYSNIWERETDYTSVHTVGNRILLFT